MSRFDDVINGHARLREAARKVTDARAFLADARSAVRAQERALEDAIIELHNAWHGLEPPFPGEEGTDA